MRLSWEGASSNRVDVLRGGERIKRTKNDGSYTDSTGGRGKALYRYRVCEAGSSTCSDVVKVRFGGRRR